MPYDDAEVGSQAASKGAKDSPITITLMYWGEAILRMIRSLFIPLSQRRRRFWHVMKALDACSQNFLRVTYNHSTGRDLPEENALRCRYHRSRDLRTLRDEARNRAEDIKVLEFSPAVELILNEHGHCAGAVLYNLETEEYFWLRQRLW